MCWRGLVYLARPLKDIDYEYCQPNDESNADYYTCVIQDEVPDT